MTYPAVLAVLNVRQFAGPVRDGPGAAAWYRQQRLAVGPLKALLSVIYFVPRGGGLMSVLHAQNLLSEEERLQILRHLEDLLESPAFAGSRRRQAFLRYVVQETLAGRGPVIKETNIAVDVFGRSNDFDAQTASIVRVTAAEVRKRLAQAYEAGLAGNLHIELPLGGYQPSFQFLPVEETHEETVPAPAATASSRRRLLWVIAALAACAVAAASSVLAVRLLRAHSPTDILWRPFLDQKTPVLICLGAPTVLSVKHQVNKWWPLQPGAMVPADDLVVMDNAMVGTGGALGAARFAELLALRHQPFFLKFGSDFAFSDLKNQPAILLGSSRWTQELSRSLRFKIERGDDRIAIVDSQAGGRTWSVSRSRPASELVEGYSLVTRLMQSESGHPILLVAGMDPRDTQAAVEFLSNDRYLGPVVKSMPADWANKSFQVVLHNTIHGNSAGSLSVAASHVW